MDPTTALLIAYLTTIAAGIFYIYLVNPSHKGRRSREELHARGMSERTFADIIEGMSDAHKELVLAQQRHLERMTTPSESLTPGPMTQLPGGAEYTFGQGVDEINQFHDTMGTPPIEDTPDWTDHMMPTERGNQPRVASVRPGDSIIPGKGNWDEMNAEGRTVANGGMVSGEEQWAGEPYGEGVGR